MIHCNHIYSPEFHEIHDAFSTTLRTKGYSTIHDIKLLPHLLALRGRFNPIDFKSCAQRNTVNCEGAAKRTFRNIEIKWSISGHLMNYLCTKLNLRNACIETCTRTFYFCSHLRKILSKETYLSSLICTIGELNKYMKCITNIWSILINEKRSRFFKKARSEKTLMLYQAKIILQIQLFSL